MNVAIRGRQASVSKNTEKADALVESRRIVERWNEQYCVGIPVTVHTGGQYHKSRTSGIAFVKDGDAVIWVAGIPGTTLLQNIKPQHMDSEESKQAIADYVKRADVRKSSVKELKSKMGIPAGMRGE